MAGTIPGFNADTVRAGLRLAMSVGLPPVEADQPTFFFSPVVTNTGPADEEGVPFNPDTRPTVAPPKQVKVPCAVEYSDVSGKVEGVGIVQPSRVSITLLDEEYAKVKGFAYVVIAGNRYFYRKTEPPVGLVSIGVWTIHCVAEDEI